ncbi:MAG: extracellular solute-binding protein [Clostridia bacterium]|nr:extracellular solute-binding protein [Clostridia bacterium]
MKKTISLILALVVLILPLTACSSNPSDESDYSYYYEEVIVQKGDKDNDNEGEDNTDTSSGKKPSSDSNSTGRNPGASSSEILKTDFDLKGKTVTMALTEEDQYNTTSFKAMISAFQTKYNCKVKTFFLDFNKYNVQVAQRMSTSEPFDICYMHGSMFPRGPISGCYADLSEAIKQVDNSAFNMDKTNKFLWEGKLYGVCDDNCAFPWIFYYNKAIFEKAGLEDPRTLYNQGKWTWDKIFEQGAEVTDSASNIFYMSNYYVQSQMYGVSSITTENGKVILNLRDPKHIASLNLLQKIYCGNDAIGQKRDGSDNRKAFLEGRNYLYPEETSKYPGLVAQVKKSMAFNKDVKNLEIVPVPILPENTEKAYPTGWYTAICAGEGSDPRVALTWAAFEATYKNEIKGSNEFDAEDQKLIAKLLAGKTLPNRHSSYVTSSAQTLSLHEYIIQEISNGEDVAKTVDKYYDQYCACIEETIGHKNYTKN